jgi:DNA-binding MurR/RpiR family transcriptional regulator
MLNLETILKRDWKKFTASEQRLATFFLQHMQELPFETAASIAQRLAVSPMTVGRFLKKIGFGDLRGVKASLRAASPESGWLSRQITRALFDDAPLNAKIKALTDAHHLPRGAEWPGIVALLAAADKVNIASFQLGRFLGLGFASALHTIRPNTYFADGSDGAYVDALLDSGPKSCLVLIDFRRYSRHFRLLAEEAAARKIPTVIITDVYCIWAREVTQHVLLLETGFDSSWERLSVAQTILELLLVDVAKRVKGREKRYEAIHQLRSKFVGFIGPDRPPATVAGGDDHDNGGPERA